jgi:hypothetical protein
MGSRAADWMECQSPPNRLRCADHAVLRKRVDQELSLVVRAALFRYQSDSLQPPNSRQNELLGTLILRAAIVTYICSLYHEAGFDATALRQVIKTRRHVNEEHDARQGGGFMARPWTSSPRRLLG